MNNVSILIPLKEYDHELMGNSLLAAIESCVLEDEIKGNENKGEKYNIYLTVPENCKDKDKLYENLGSIKEMIHVVEKKDGEPLWFSMQVNEFAKSVDTKWFSVLEWDDSYCPTTFSNFATYAEFYPDVDIFMMLNEVYDNSEQMTGYANEIVWASSFSSEMGVVDFDSLETFNEYNLTGAFINREKFLEVGGLKESMQVSFWSEFLLRATYNNMKVYVIPKVGYTHLVMRKGSLSDYYTNTMSDKEVSWWINLAKEEYFFKEDRKKTYEESKNDNVESIEDLK